MGAAKDPAFVQKMKDGYTDCYKVSNQLSLDKQSDPVVQQWGRQMAFFKCAKELEEKTCYQALLKVKLENFYPTLNKTKLAADFGGDVYEAASWAATVEAAMMSPEERAVQNFLVRGIF
jgi:hypothetical protein